MSELDAGFEAELADHTREQLERNLVGKKNNALWKAIQASFDALDNSEYDLDSIKDSLVGPELTETPDGLTVRWGWDHPAAEFFEFGTSDHTINGNPVLSFVWEDPPAWVKEEFDQARSSGGQFRSGWRVFFHSVNVDGVNEVAFTRAGLRRLELELKGKITL